MSKTKFFVGIDIAKDTFTAAIFVNPDKPIPALDGIPNKLSGYDQFESWLIKHQVKPENSLICLEATGVYGENLCYWMAAHRYQIVVEQPLKVKRAFNIKDHKNDQVDSRKIAEYAFRFVDELRYWHPKEDAIEHLRILLTTREQLVEQKTASTNALKALKHKVVQTPLAIKVYQENIERLQKQIKQIEKELQNYIDQRPEFKSTVQNLQTIPGVGLLLSVNLLVATDGFRNDLAFDYRKASAFTGICPYEYSSGTSVYRRPRTPKFGPARMRKLLHLAARSVVTHTERFKRYYLEKQLQGKHKKLIINNVANKLLKIMCSIIRTQRPYLANFISVNPQNALINN